MVHQSPRSESMRWATHNRTVKELCSKRALKRPTARIKRRLIRTLPAHVEKRFGVVPFAVEAGHLIVAGSKVPCANLYEEMKNFTRLPIEFHLVTKENYEELRALL